MVCIIGFGELDKNLIIPIIGGIALTLINKFYIEYPLFVKYPFIICILSGLSMCLAIIPFLISKLQYKKKVKSKEYIAKIKKMRLRKYFLIFITTLLDFIQSIVLYIISFRKIFDYWIIDIIIIYLFSYFILKARLYKHQYLSTIIILLSNIFLFYYNLRYNQFNFIHILFDLFFEVFVCSIYVINKYNMEYHFCSPYELCFYNGIITTILYGISFLVFSIYDKQYLDHYVQYFNLFNFREFIFILSFIILNFVYNISILLTNKYYNPFYILILLIFAVIIQNCFPPYSLNFISIYINNFILIFAILVFNEVIELNCFGLATNIKRNIKERADTDILIDNHDDMMFEENPYPITGDYYAIELGENHINGDE